MSTARLARKAGEPALMTGMVLAGSSQPDDVDALKRLVLAREAELAAAQVEIDRAKARENSAEAMILHLRLAVEKMRRELYGQRSERGAPARSDGARTGGAGGKSRRGRACGRDGG